MENQAIEEKPKKVNPWLIVGGVLIVAVLVGAAFMAGRLLKKPAVANQGELTIMGEGGQVMVQKEFEVERPKELPDRPPDATGVMQKVENNSIFVGASSGPVGIMVKKVDGQVDMSVQSEGDTTTVEVVVTKETRLYKDVAAFQMAEGGPATTKIEQKIVPATLDELKGQALVTAWGERKGDRLIAEVVLCTIFPELDE